MIADTDESSAMLSDEEIKWIIEQAPSNVNKQLAMAFRQCASYCARKPTTRKLGPQEENVRERLIYYKAQARYYEKKQDKVGIPPLPNYQKEKTFEKDMMSNV